MELQSVTSIKDLIERAREAEAEQELAQAAELYEQAIKEDPADDYAYDRLMIIYRKLKEYKKEQRVINTGIKAFERFYRSRHSRSKKVAEISNALLKSTGLADKKGNHLYDPEPIGRWKKRLVILEKKIKK